MEGKVEAAVFTFVMVMLSIAFYHSFVKDYTPKNVQGWIGL